MVDFAVTFIAIGIIFGRLYLLKPRYNAKKRRKESMLITACFMKITTYVEENENPRRCGQRRRRNWGGCTAR